MMEPVILSSAHTPDGVKRREALLKEAIKKGKVSNTCREEFARELRSAARGEKSKTDKEKAKELRALAECCV